TGTATLIGPLDTSSETAGTTALSIQPSTHNLFAISSPTLSTEFLWSLDKATGTATLIAPITGTPVPEIIHDMSFRPSDGTLFVIGSFRSEPSVVLYTIN